MVKPCFLHHNFFFFLNLLFCKDSQLCLLTIWCIKEDGWAMEYCYSICGSLTTVFNFCFCFPLEMQNLPSLNGDFHSSLSPCFYKRCSVFYFCLKGEGGMGWKIRKLCCSILVPKMIKCEKNRLVPGPCNQNRFCTGDIKRAKHSWNNLCWVQV